MSRCAAIWSLCAAALIGAAGWVGCASRTVPLPPPTVEQISAPDPNGLVTVTGIALEGASVGVLNEESMNGVIVPVMGDECDRACPFEATLQAESDDSLRVWQFTGTGNAIWRPVP
ncbi:MAG: hypothetical protein OXU20_20775 [Myxococcales bacterium]|nr:hypothetical protein [Myxococcales bacterium]MDD9967406.1 hypothetical protein [Myxococcales bacterium]